MVSTVHLWLLQEKIKEYFRGKYSAENQKKKGNNNNKIINKLIEKSISESNVNDNNNSKI